MCIRITSRFKRKNRGPGTEPIQATEAIRAPVNAITTRVSADIVENAKPIAGVVKTNTQPSFRPLGENTSIVAKAPTLAASVLTKPTSITSMGSLKTTVTRADRAPKPPLNINIVTRRSRLLAPSGTAFRATRTDPTGGWAASCGQQYD